MRIVRRSSPWLATLALVCVAGIARADGPREESRAAFRRGVVLVQSGDYKRARDAFLDAYRLFAHPSILLNLGIARWKLGEFPAAEQDLARFLSDDGGASQEDIANARAALAAVRAKLGTLRVRVAPEGARATLDGQAVALVPGELVEVRAVLGDHVLDAQAEGFTSRHIQVTVDASRATVVDLHLATSNAAREGSPATEGDNTRRVVGWVLVGVGGATGVVGLIAGLRAEALAHDYNTAPAGAQEDRTRSEGVFFRTTADVAFLVGIASVGVGAYLLLAPSPNKGGVSGVIGPGFTGVRGTF